MTSTKYPPSPWHAAHGSPTRSARRLAARILRSASAGLARLARRLAAPPIALRHPEPRLEFYAEAGAPEGALFVDGELVGRVPGVQRL
jgi:hypothetical protein